MDQEWDEQRGDHGGPNGESNAEDTQGARVQKVLKEANRRLAADLTAAKGGLREREAELEEARKQNGMLREEAVQREQLVARLEEDILKVGGCGAFPRA